MVKIRALTLEMRTADKIISEFAFCLIGWLLGWLVVWMVGWGFEIWFSFGGMSFLCLFKFFQLSL